MQYWHVEDRMFTTGDGREISSSFAKMGATIAGMGWAVLGLALFVPVAAVGSTTGAGRIAAIAILTAAFGCFGVMAVWFSRVLFWRWKTRNIEVFSPTVYAIPEWLGLVIGLAAGLALSISWTS